jgi:hypothetical protein
MLRPSDVGTMIHRGTGLFLRCSFLACGLLVAGSADTQAQNAERSSDAVQTSAALSSVQNVRRTSAFASSLPEEQIDDHLSRLLGWVLRSYNDSGPLHLISDAPDAQNGLGMTNARMKALQQTYWLQDNALYGAGALLEYAPAVGQSLSDSWHAKWDEHFGKYCPETQSSYVVGRLPQYDQPGAVVTDMRCHLPRPGMWQSFRMHQYPSPQDDGFNDLPKPIIGMDHPSDEMMQTQLASIRTTAVRDLLKYGCLRQVLLGNRAAAQQMFDLALAQWDGNGFKTTKNDASQGGSLLGTYWTRDVAFALLCANALGEGHQAMFGQGVSKLSLEQKLWEAQSSSGGIWTNYCSGSACQGPHIPAIAKQTNEIAPLVLLIYGRNLWQHQP